MKHTMVNHIHLRSLILFCLVFVTTFSMAQPTFIINSIPNNTPPDDPIYIVGSFNAWDPADPDFALQKNASEQWFIVMPEMSSGSRIEFKFTRGDWATVEKGANGEEIANRVFIYGNGATEEYDVLNWADQGGGGASSTAADNVHIMDESFYISQLDRHRRIWIYLPPDYENTSLDYPVLYMHDGQNLFDQYTSFAGEWEVDETLNNLAQEGIQVPIVIGIDNGGAERINELTPWVNQQYGGGDGALYAAFIVETLKPYVDEHYRTQAGRETTGIMGSSLGGLISQYGALKYQDVFSKAGIFSPSYWFSDSVWSFTSEMGKQQSMKLYQMAGGQESASMVPNMQAMHDSLRALGFINTELITKVVPNGQHNEASWRNAFADAYLWLFSDFANATEEFIEKEIVISPNPCLNEIHILNYQSRKSDSITIQDLSGHILLKVVSIISNNIDVSSLASGSYVLVIKSDGNSSRQKFIKQ